MGIRDRLAEQGKKITRSGAFVRLVGNDKVMRVATGVMDARSRMRAASERMSEAWTILLNGHELPNIDPALEGEADVTGAPSAKRNGHATNGASHGANGHAISATPAHAPPSRATGGGGATVEVTAAEQSLAKDMAARTSLSRIGGKDVFEKCQKFMTADNARAMGMYPFFRPLDFNNGPEAQLEGKTVTMLGSNNYLGLTTHPRVREAAKAAIEKYGTSMTGSRLVNGTMRLHKELEDKLAAYHGKEAGLVFTTGYQVNIASISALLANKRSVAVIDKDDHASIYDGVRLAQAAGARMVRYKHSDPAALDQALSELDDAEGALVITDGVFSSQGEIANLPGIVEVTKRHKARSSWTTRTRSASSARTAAAPRRTSASTKKSTSSAAPSRRASPRSAAGSSATARSSITSSTLRTASSSPRAPRRRASPPRWPRSR